MPTLPQIQLAEQQITQQLNQFLASLDELELTPEQEQAKIDNFFREFLANEAELKEKINASCWYLTSLKKDAEYYREQAARLTQQARVTENRFESFKAYITHIVDSKGGKLPTKDFPKLAVRNTPASVEVDETYQGEIPEQYLKPRQFSKTAIAASLKAGVELPFAQLVSKGKALFGLK